MKKTFLILIPLLLFVFCIEISSTIAQNENKTEEQTQATDKETSNKKVKPDSNITLEKILENYYQAIGGDEGWKSLKTMKFTGSMYTKDATFKTAALYKRPNICRIDFQAGRLYFLEVYDGELAWQMSAGSRNGATILKGKRAKEMIDTCDFDGPLIDHKKKGHQIKYAGVQEIEDRWAYVLEVKTKTGNEDKYFLDTETFLPFMVKGSTEIQGQEFNTTIKVGQYMELGDIKIPFEYQYIVDNNSSTETLEIKTLELNPEIEDEMFMMPKRPQDLR